MAILQSLQMFSKIEFILNICSTFLTKFQLLFGLWFIYLSVKHKFINCSLYPCRELHNDIGNRKQEMPWYPPKPSFILVYNMRNGNPLIGLTFLIVVLIKNDILSMTLELAWILLFSITSAIWALGPSWWCCWGSLGGLALLRKYLSVGREALSVKASCQVTFLLTLLHAFMWGCEWSTFSSYLHGCCFLPCLPILVGCMSLET